MKYHPQVQTKYEWRRFLQNDIEAIESMHKELVLAFWSVWADAWWCGGRGHGFKRPHPTLYFVFKLNYFEDFLKLFNCHHVWTCIWIDGIDVCIIWWINCEQNLKNVFYSRYTFLDNCTVKHFLQYLIKKMFMYDFIFKISTFTRFIHQLLWRRTTSDKVLDLPLFCHRFFIAWHCH